MVPAAPSKTPKKDGSRKAGSKKDGPKKDAFPVEWVEKDLPKSRKQFIVTIPATGVRRFFDAAIQHFRNTEPMPSGFRKGAKVRTVRDRKDPDTSHLRDTPG